MAMRRMPVYVVCESEPIGRAITEGITEFDKLTGLESDVHWASNLEPAMASIASFTMVLEWPEDSERAEAWLNH